MGRAWLHPSFKNMIRNLHKSLPLTCCWPLISNMTTPSCKGVSKYNNYLGGHVPVILSYKKGKRNFSEQLAVSVISISHAKCINIIIMWRQSDKSKKKTKHSYRPLIEFDCAEFFDLIPPSHKVKKVSKL